MLPAIHRLMFPIAAIALLFAAATASAQSALPSGPPLPKMTLVLEKQSINVEVAVSWESRAKGLMFREKMGRNEGMLFVFDQPGYHSMWMKNTFLPLSVAFMDEKGRILNIADMEPHSETNHFASGPALYALEMNKGWFREHGIAPGYVIKGLEKATRIR